MPSWASSSSSCGEALGLGVVEARCRLVEQEHLRPGRQRPPQLDEAGQARGHGVDPLVGDGSDADSVDEAFGLGRGVDRLVLGPAPADLGRGEDVVARRERAEDLESLEGAGDAELGPVVRLLVR